MVHFKRKIVLATATAVCLVVAALAPPRTAAQPSAGGPADGRANGNQSLLANHLLVTWYGNPNTARMGVLGRNKGAARADALRKQVAAYRDLTKHGVLGAYHLVAVVAQPLPGKDGKWRRRESPKIIRALLDEARANGFLLIVDVQPGRATVADEVRWLEPFLKEPDVHLALDPEFDMPEGQVPGQRIGRMPASEVNAALDELERIRAACRLPPKVLIVHQFTLGMLPDKQNIRVRPGIDLVLDMDGFGSPALKHWTYRTVIRQHALPFMGFKLFYQQDTGLLKPADVLALTPASSVVIYQ